MPDENSLRERFDRLDAIALRRAEMQEEELDAIQTYRAEHGGYAAELEREFEARQLERKERQDAIEFRAWVKQRDDELFGLIRRQTELMGRIVRALERR